MGSKKNEIGEFGRRVSTAIRIEAASRHQSGKELAQIVGKSSPYVSRRLHDEAEWTITDLGRLCDAWGITPEKLLNSAQTGTWSLRP